MSVAMLATALLLAPGDLTITPPSIGIPVGVTPIGKWPTFETDPRVGHREIKIRYTVTADRLAVGGAIKLAFAYHCVDASNPHLARNDGYVVGPSPNLALFPVGAFQTVRPGSANYTTARTSVPLATVTLDTPVSAPDDATMLRAVLKGRALSKGDWIEFTFGDPGKGGPGATISYHPGRPVLLCYEDLDGDQAFELSHDPFPEFVSSAETPTALRLNLPVTAVADQPFSGTIDVLQGVDAPSECLLPVEGYVGRVRIDEVGGGGSTTIDFDPAMRGAARFSWSFAGLGIHRLIATELLPDGSDGSLIGFSNPVEVRSDRAETAIYCGDLHRHSCEGGHAAIPDYSAWGTLWNGRQDFGAVLEHTSPEYSGFRHANAVARRFQDDVDPGEVEFVAFPGYEWTLTGSHRHVILADIADEVACVERPYFGAETPPPTFYDTVVDLLGAVRGHPSGPDRIAIPHHSLWDLGAGTKFEWGPMRDDPAQPLVEIMSGHGSSERNYPEPAVASDYVMHGDVARQRPEADLASVQAALALGHRFGFVGGSDNHGAVLTMNFLAVSDTDESSFYARGGLTFVIGDVGTTRLRDRVWTGITNRRTYVTTGARMLLEWYAVGNRRRRGAGGELSARNVSFFFRAVPSAVASDRIPKIVRHELWRDGNVLVDAADYAPALDELDMEVADPRPLRDGAYHPYYAKVIQDDDHVGWASPIWVKHTR